MGGLLFGGLRHCRHYSTRRLLSSRLFIRLDAPAIIAGIPARRVPVRLPAFIPAP